MENTGFSFGKNWERFVNTCFTDERVEVSKRHILAFLGRENLDSITFMDIGCGSGLSSLAAHRAGAAYIVSFDIDPYSVKTTQKLKEIEGNPTNWIVLEGSILNPQFIATLTPADLIYSWGVLHHTGAMWNAVANAMDLVKSGGQLYIALYKTTAKSKYWIRIKRLYNHCGQLAKRLMELAYVAYFVLVQLRARQNPITTVRNYKQRRGMEFMTDVRDWLGGWPYEDATVDEVHAFFDEHGWQLIKDKIGPTMGEYLFRKQV